jgi:hypothetical protein
MQCPDRRPWRRVASIAALALAATGCSGFLGSDDEADQAVDESVYVEPDLESESTVLNIYLSDDGFDPSTIFLPAGRHTKLILRNRGNAEYHYRVSGLVPTQMSWLLVPDITEDDMLAMSVEELEALGLADDIRDVEHELHHLTPVFVPFREESPAGIKPLANEVHGYVTRGTLDVLDFFPTNTGTFVIEDVLHPGVTGKAIVFDPAAVGAGSDT